MNTASELARQLADRVLEVARYLYPNGKHVNQHWVVALFRASQANR